MRVEVLTSLYPGPSRPFEGVFAERRWLGMRARGHEVSVTQPLPAALPLGRFGPSDWEEIRRLPGREERGGIFVERPRYLHLPRSPRANARRFARTGTKAILARGRPDVVVADYAWPAAAAAPRLARLGVPCLVNGRGSDVLQVASEAGLGPELAAYLRAAGHWCAVSADLVRAMDELGGAPGNGRLVPNGVDLEAFRPADRGAARERLGEPFVSFEGALVLVCGHLIERKDPLLALAAFEAGAPAGAHCVFVGRGPLAPMLERAVEERGLAQRVHLLGEVAPESLSWWYAAADVLLLTSRREGRPNVVLEALASGRPVVATAAGGTAEVLGSWCSRSLVKERDPERIGAALAAILRDPPPPEELRASVEALSWTAGLEALEAALEAAVRGAPSARSVESA